MKDVINMEKEISINIINKVQKCIHKISIVKAGTDYRVVAANERAINHYLRNYSYEQRLELLKIMFWYTGYDNARGLKLLKEMGWQINYD